VKIKQTGLITVLRSRKPGHCQFIDGSDARIIMSLDEAAPTRLWTGDPSRAHAAKSPREQALLLRPIRGKYARSSHRQRRTFAKLPAFITDILIVIKAYAVLRQKLYARFSQHTFDQGSRVLVSRVTAHLDIRDRVSMKTGRLSQVPNRPIPRSTCHSYLCTCATVTSDEVPAMITMSTNQRGIQ
jgi:hypothetical protein